MPNPLHTGGVTSSILVASTIKAKTIPLPHDEGGDALLKPAHDQKHRFGCVHTRKDSRDEEQSHAHATSLLVGFLSAIMGCFALR